MGHSNYRFDPATPNHIPMLLDWMKAPDVQQWWGAPDDHVRVLQEDVANPALDMRIVTLNDTPFALVQDYDVHHWDKPLYAEHPKGSRAIAAFIGVPDMLGKGHGRRFLSERVEAIIKAGAPLVAIDPAAKNTRAIRAYRAAGFSGSAVQTDEDGLSVIPMIYKKDSSQ